MLFLYIKLKEIFSTQFIKKLYPKSFNILIWSLYRGKSLKDNLFFRADWIIYRGFGCELKNHNFAFKLVYFAMKFGDLLLLVSKE